MPVSIVKVSCIIPVYNASPYLAEAIQSILNQTYKNFEILLIDDYSTDNSWEIINQFAKKYPDKIIPHRNEKNLGLSKTLNKALRLSRGDYVARMDADDISLPDRFAKQVHVLDTQKDIAIVGTFWRYMNNGIVPEVPVNTKEIKLYTLINNPLGHPTVMFRRQVVLDKAGLYDESAEFIEDFEFWCRSLDNLKAINIPEVLLNYRIHANQISNSKASAQHQALFKFRVIQASKVFKSKQLSSKFIRLLDIHSNLSIKDFFYFILLSTLMVLLNIKTRTFTSKELLFFLFKTTYYKRKIIT